MYKVLIAEDELFVRLGIKNGIDWEQFNMQVICDVENGQKALENIKKYSPDIIITDILMPVMDGQKLMEAIHDLPYEPYVIVITCLQDFNLVTKLLSYGIRDYLLKATMTEDEIGKCLKKAQLFFEKGAVRREKSDTGFISQSEQCNQAMEAFFQGKETSEKTIEVLASNNIYIGHNPMVMALCPIEAVYDYQENSVSVPSSNLYPNLYDLLKNRSYRGYTLYSFFLEEKHIIILLCCKPDCPIEEEKASSLDSFQMIHDDIQDLLHIHVSFLLNFVEKGLSGLKDGFHESLQVLDRHYLDGMNSVVCSWDNNISARVEASYKQLYQHCDWIGRCLGKSAVEQYNKLIADFRNNVIKSREEMLYCLMAISHFICSYFKEHMEDEKKQCDKLMVRYPYLTEGVSALSSLLKSCEQYYLQHEMKYYRKEIEKALQIINHALNDSDLSLRYICDQIGLSEAYFSTLFHQEMKMPFIKYLANARIERAKYLLEHTECKIFDIALQAGFRDDAYFSRVFKKSTGVSPSEWRSLWLL